MRRPAATARSDSLRRGFAAGLIVAAALLAYANSWQAPFVYDDLLAIPQNPTLRHLWPLTDVLRTPAEGGLTVSGRPVLNLSLALNYAISGPQVWSYHVANTLIHAGAGLLLFGIVRHTLRRRRESGGDQSRGDALALVIAGLWTVHPLHTQAITYTVQRAESLMGFFFLLTLYTFIRGSAAAGSGDNSRRGAGWLAASVASCALGMGTKEVMATAPLLVLLYDRTFVAGGLAAAWRARRPYYVALAATWLVLGALLLSTGGNRGGTVGLGVGLPLWAYPLTQFTAVAHYLRLAVWPNPLVFEYGTSWVRNPAEILPAAAVVLPLLLATGLALRFWPAAGFLGAWFFGILAPTSLAPGTIQMIVEHRMYLPLAAVIAGLAWAAHRAGGRIVLVAGAAAGLACLGLTVRRNQDYASPLALWADTVAKRPLNPRAHAGLAEALTAAGRHTEAIQARREAVRLLPDESHYHYNLALTLAEAGQTAEAERHYRLALRLHPEEPRTHNNLAILLVRLGRNAAAIPHYETAARLRPAEPLYHYNLGIALMRAERLTEAAASYATVLRLQPDHADAHFNLGAALLRLNRPAEALEHYATAVRLQPDEPDYVAGYGGALQRAGRPAEAIAQFEAWARAAPRQALARIKLGNALLDAGRVAEAIPHYQAALALSPGEAETHHNLGIAHARLERWDEARRAFDEALRLRPDYADARRSREQLRQVTGR